MSETTNASSSGITMAWIDHNVHLLLEDVHLIAGQAQLILARPRTVRLGCGRYDLCNVAIGGKANRAKTRAP